MRSYLSKVGLLKMPDFRNRGFGRRSPCFQKCTGAINRFCNLFLAVGLSRITSLPALMSSLLMSAVRRFSLPLIAAFFALYVIWGSTYLVIRIGVEYWPPLMLGGVR